jgi:DNA-directed RNA polymerase subunit alpha
MRWKNLQMPKEVIREDVEEPQFVGRFVMEPLERGFGNTIGNALRRVLLSALQGSAVVSLRIEGVPHEFSSIPGVYEDVTDIVLNIKKLWVKLHADEMKIMTLECKGKGKYSAKDIQCPSEIEIRNPDQHIVELTDDITLKIEMDVDTGRSYVLADHNKRADAPKGTVFIDSLFSPVVSVNYSVENTRIGHKTDYDRLTFEVKTNGILDPEEAVGFGAKLLKDHLQLLIHTEEEIEVEEEEVEDEETLRIRQLLQTRVEELELSVRSSNCLRAANIQILADLVRKTESEMLKYRNFGRKSLNELTGILEDLGISFGMDVDKFLEPKKKE